MIDRSRRSRVLVGCALAAVTALMAGPAAAKDQQTLRMRTLAATCAQCHGTDGHAVEGEPLVRLAGLQQDYILQQLLAFRSGQRPATIMHQISRGYSQDQLTALAKYFSEQK